MTETLPPEIVMDDVQIDEAVRFINDRIIAIVYNGSLEIGAYVLEKFFNNDIHLAGSRNGYKLVSYRKLCAHPDMTVPRTTLMEMVRAAAQRNFLMDKGIPVSALKFSHLISLTRLKNDEEKLALAQECIDNRLTVEELKLRIREIQQQSINPPDGLAASVEKYLGGINRWIRRVSAPAGMTNTNLIGDMPPSEKEKILDAAGGILEDMSVITNRIRELVTILTQPAVPPVIEGDISGEA